MMDYKQPSSGPGEDSTSVEETRHALERQRAAALGVVHDTFIRRRETREGWIKALLRTSSMLLGSQSLPSNIKAQLMPVWRRI
jgi:hypothetical protein